MPEVHERRRAALRELLAERELEAALVTRLVNVRYLTGFSGSNGGLLVLPDRAVLATDGRYTTQAERQAPDVERVITADVPGTLAKRLPGAAGFEAHDMTVELYERLTGEGAALTATGRLVERLRAVKDEEEIAAIGRACAVADRAFAELLDTIAPGRTERDVAAELEARMRAHGADGPSFETICASGPNSAVPHHRPTGREIGRGELLKLDFGALVDGYHSDMTRTVVVGPPEDWQRELHALVSVAQAAGIAALAPGATCGDLDKAARDVISDAGYGDQYPHSLGHGVGLEIHEAPTLRGGASDILRDRMPVTVEPGVYLPGRGGVRIEDLLVVRDGGPEMLTTSTRELLVL